MSQVNDFRNALIAVSDDKELTHEVICVWIESSCGAFPVQGLEIPGVPATNGLVVILDDRGSDGPPQIALLMDKAFIGGETDDEQWQFAAEMMNLPQFEEHAETSLRDAYSEEEVVKTMNDFRFARAKMRRGFL